MPSWLKREKWDALTPEEKESFSPVSPDFVVEILTLDDSLKRLRAKMQEYIDNGARLGWLINLETGQAEIYRPNQDVEILDNPSTLSDENVLPGFTLNLNSIMS